MVDYPRHVANDGDSGITWPLIKLGLLVLGGLAAIGLVMSVLEPLLIIGVLVGVGYVGFRVFSGNKALPGNEHEALPGSRSGDPLERRMRELEALDKKLDAEIHKHS